MVEKKKLICQPSNVITSAELLALFSLTAYHRPLEKRVQELSILAEMALPALFDDEDVKVDQFRCPKKDVTVLGHDGNRSPAFPNGV